MFRDSIGPFYAISSGCCAAAASLFGKLAGREDLTSMVSVISATLFVVLMIVNNAAVWTLFVKALQSSETSLLPTVTSAATNYVCSAVVGMWLFGEITSTLWWTGTFLVVLGLLLVCHSNSSTQNNIKSKQM